MKTDVGKLISVCSTNEHLLNHFTTQFESINEQLKGNSAKILNFEHRIQEIQSSYNESRIDMLKMVEQQIKTMGESVQRATQLAESTFTTINGHTSKLNEQDSAISLSKLKVEALIKEVAGVYRDMGNLENFKQDRQTATNQYKDLMNSYNHLYT